MPRILCIEDDVETRILIKKSLESAGMVVDTVWNGEKGIEAAKNGFFDCVVLDLMMPGMDGFQVIDALKSQEPTSGIPLVVVTARLDDESRERALKVGADRYLVKPFNIHELVEIILRLVNREGVGADAGPP